MRKQSTVHFSEVLSQWPPEKLPGRRTLILGEVNSGKTRLTERYLVALCGMGLAAQMVVVDLAPRVEEQSSARKGLKGVGGRLGLPDKRILLLSTLVRAPRLSMPTEAEALEVARQNVERIHKLWEQAATSGRGIVVINDLSLALQTGEWRDLESLLDNMQTVLANCYFGVSLGQGVLSEQERRATNALLPLFDRVLRL